MFSAKADTTARAVSAALPSPRVRLTGPKEAKQARMCAPASGSGPDPRSTVVSSSVQSSLSVAVVWGVTSAAKRVEKASATHWSW